MLTEVIGWSAATVLLLTMSRQVWTQWHSGSVAGVSSWLFVGQVTASAGFTLYSVLLGSSVFVFTNALLLINALLGLWIDRRNRRHVALQKNQRVRA